MNEPTTIVRTNVFATEEEAKEISKLADEARNTPVIAFSVQHGIERGGLSGEAWTRVNKACHKAAMDHGLPDFEGYYGIDLSNREFVRT